MNYTPINKILNNKNISKIENKIVKIHGWVKNKRYSKIGLFFIDIKDGSCLNPIQIIIEKKYIKKNKKIKKINTGWTLIVNGITKKNKKNNKIEIYVKKIKILGNIKKQNKYPITKKYHTLEYLRKYSHLRSRTYLIESIIKIRNTLIFSIHNYLQKKNFYFINTPIITSLDTEGNSKMFEIKNDFFNKKTYLTVSGQLNLETYIYTLSKVYNIGPTFRAENSNTKKHLAEFWMLELEVALYNINNIINISKNILSYCCKKILKNNEQEINFILKYTKKKTIKHILNIIDKKFIKIKYKKIFNILKKKEKKFKQKIIWGIDISTEIEKYLTEKYFKSPIIITNYPKEIKPFYMKKNKNKKTVSCMDIILPKVGEIIGGSEREYNINKLDNNIKEKKLNIKKYWWYRDLRKYGTIPHSGFGMGIERLLMYITNMKNIREVIPFFRYPNNLEY